MLLGVSLMACACHVGSSKVKAKRKLNGAVSGFLCYSTSLPPCTQKCRRSQCSHAALKRVRRSTPGRQSGVVGRKERGARQGRSGSIRHDEATMRRGRAPRRTVATHRYHDCLTATLMPRYHSRPVGVAGGCRHHHRRLPRQAKLITINVRLDE